jgi:DNA-binding MarR family transcriptional regulator
VLKRLEASGLVRRTRRLHDEREVEIGLTVPGRALRERAIDVRKEIVHQLKMTEPEIASLRADLNVLIATLNAAD